MKIRMIVEYDPDWPVHGKEEDKKEWFEQEKKDWIEGNVSVRDVMEIGGTVTWRTVP